MKVGIIGPYKNYIDRVTFEKFMPNNTTEIICGRMGKLRNAAEIYTLIYNIKFSPVNYDEKYGRNARLQNNIEIIKKSDFIIIFNFKKDCLTDFAVKHCVTLNVPFKIIKLKPDFMKNI